MDKTYLYIGIGVVALAVIGGGAWWYFSRPKSDPSAPSVPPRPSAPSGPTGPTGPGLYDRNLCGGCKGGTCSFLTKGGAAASLDGCSDGLTHTFNCVGNKPQACPYQMPGNWRWDTVSDASGNVLGCRPPADGTLGNGTGTAYNESVYGFGAPYMVALYSGTDSNFETQLKKAGGTFAQIGQVYAATSGKAGTPGWGNTDTFAAVADGSIFRAYAAYLGEKHDPNSFETGITQPKVGEGMPWWATGECKSEPHTQQRCTHAWVYLPADKVVSSQSGSAYKQVWPECSAITEASQCAAMNGCNWKAGACGSCKE